MSRQAGLVARDELLLDGVVEDAVILDKRSERARAAIRLAFGLWALLNGICIASQSGESIGLAAKQSLTIVEQVSLHNDVCE